MYNSFCIHCSWQYQSIIGNIFFNCNQVRACNIYYGLIISFQGLVRKCRDTKKTTQQIPWGKKNPSIYKGFSINPNRLFINFTTRILHVSPTITYVHRTTLEKINLKFSSSLYTDAAFFKSQLRTFIY